MLNKIYDFSGKLLRRIVDHHQMLHPSNQVTIFVAGVRALEFLGNESFLKFERGKWRKEISSNARVYQWHSVMFENEKLAIYQIPHFSRANSGEKLKPCAEWLRDELLRQEST